MDDALRGITLDRDLLEDYSDDDDEEDDDDVLGIPQVEWRDLPINLVPRGAIATGFGPIIKLAGELFARALSMSVPVSAQSLVVAAGLEASIRTDPDREATAVVGRLRRIPG